MAQNIGGKTLEITRLGTYLENLNADIEVWKAVSTNFANVATNAANSVYSIQNVAGVSVKSVWATVEYEILRGYEIIYGVVDGQGITLY